MSPRIKTPPFGDPADLGEQAPAEQEMAQLTDYLLELFGGPAGDESAAGMAMRLLDDYQTHVCQPSPSSSEMARSLMEAYLPRHVNDFARQIFEIDYPMAPEHFIGAILRLAYDSGIFPQAATYLDPDWKMGEPVDPGTFVCGGCGEKKKADRIGQKFCSNRCAALIGRRY